jgi:hypothetical protein
LYKKKETCNHSVVYVASSRCNCSQLKKGGYTNLSGRIQL